MLFEEGYPHIMNARRRPPTMSKWNQGGLGAVRRLIGPVIDSFRNNRVAVADVFPLLQGLELRQRIVNSERCAPEQGAEPFV